MGKIIDEKILHIIIKDKNCYFDVIKDMEVSKELALHSLSQGNSETSADIDAYFTPVLCAHIKNQRQNIFDRQILQQGPAKKIMSQTFLK